MQLELFFCKSLEEQALPEFEPDGVFDPLGFSPSEPDLEDEHFFICEPYLAVPDCMRVLN